MKRVLQGGAALKLRYKNEEIECVDGFYIVGTFGGKLQQ